jgi:hypothetical protein
MSIKNLAGTDDDIKLILSLEDYNGIWRKIASATSACPWRVFLARGGALDE